MQNIKGQIVEQDVAVYYNHFPVSDVNFFFFFVVFTSHVLQCSAERFWMSKKDML